MSSKHIDAVPRRLVRKPARVFNTEAKADRPKEEQAGREPSRASNASKEPAKSDTAKKPVVSTEEVQATHPNLANRAWAAVEPIVTPSFTNTVDFAESKAWESAGAMESDAEDWVKDLKFDSIISSFLQKTLMSTTFGLFPLLYLGLAATIAAIHNKPTSLGSDGFLGTLVQDAKYAAISNAITVGVTLFPIGFGLILCQLLKTCARWKAEHGTRLLTLEQILASKSFGSAVQAPAKFKRINFIAIGLIILWAVSPITTQALQRIFTIGQGPTPTTQLTVQVLDLLNGISIFEDSDAMVAYGPPSVIYSSSLLVPEALVNTSRTDVYGNPKIPLLSDVQSVMAPDQDGWYDIGINMTAIENASPGGAQTSWTSLLGIPISGVPANSSAGSVYSSFNFTTGYLSLHCEPFIGMRNESTNNGYSNCLSLDSSCKIGGVTDSFGIGFANAVNKATGFPNIIFSSRTIQSPLQYVSTTCAVDVVTVDVLTSCAGKSCAIAKMKPNSNKSSSALSGSAFLNMILAFAYNNPAKPLDVLGMSSTVENWLFDPNTPIIPMQSLSQNLYVNISKVPLDIFNARFSVAINTFYQVGLGADAFVASLPDHFEDGQLSLIQTSASAYTMRSVYKCSWGWLIVLLVSCMVVIVCILVEMYLATRVLGPDILGYVSTITHGGSVAAPAEAAGGSTLDGAQRAQLLAHVKVRMRDVQPQEPVGKIALVPGDGAPLIKGRKYI